MRYSGEMQQGGSIFHSLTSPWTAKTHIFSTLERGIMSSAYPRSTAILNPHLAQESFPISPPVPSRKEAQDQHAHQRLLGVQVSVCLIQDPISAAVQDAAWGEVPPPLQPRPRQPRQPRQLAARRESVVIILALRSGRQTTWARGCSRLRAVRPARLQGNCRTCCVEIP